MNEPNGFQLTWGKYWQLLYADLDTANDYPTARPLLGHYTSLENVEKILRSEEMWLSNPLLMNDHEEVRFGVLNGLEIIRTSNLLRNALATDQRRDIFFDALDAESEMYGTEHVLDLYVMCFSVHQHDNDDGQLSMWRGYGNQGKGAAIVFDTSQLPVPENSPLVLGSVWYASQEDRKVKISEKIEEVANFLTSNLIPDEYVASFATGLFGRLCLFAIFSKHLGFKEENEWRLVYLKDRDQPESENAQRKYEKYYSYFNGLNGIQPKLKLPVGELLQGINANVTFSDLVHSIIIGPSSASPLAKRSVERMLSSIEKRNLIPKIKSSGIPFRG
jgi:Protein of unknown function (DUF2971)